MTNTWCRKGWQMWNQHSSQNNYSHALKPYACNPKLSANMPRPPAIQTPTTQGYTSTRTATEGYDREHTKEKKYNKKGKNEQIKKKTQRHIEEDRSKKKNNEKYKRCKTMKNLRQNKISEQ
jgi:hypothetical protein